MHKDADSVHAMTRADTLFSDLSDPVKTKPTDGHYIAVHCSTNSSRVQFSTTQTRPTQNVPVVATAVNICSAFIWNEWCEGGMTDIHNAISPAGLKF